MITNTHLKELFQARVLRNSKDPGANEMWALRSLKLFDIAVEVAESTLDDDELLSESLIINCAGLESLEAFTYYKYGNQETPIYQYLHELPGFEWRGPKNAEAERQHLYLLALVKKFLVIEND